MTTTSGDNSTGEQRSFPMPGTPYYGYIDDPNYQSKFLGSFKFLNKLIVPLYPITALLFRLFGFKVYLLTHKGRTSGTIYRTPLEYDFVDGVMQGGGVNPRKSNWFRNIQAHPDEVWVQVGSRKFHARIEMLGDQGSIDVMKFYVRTHPNYSRFIGWDPDLDDLETADFSQIPKVWQFFRIHEREKQS